jgi:hypothetical protein
MASLILRAWILEAVVYDPHPVHPLSSPFLYVRFLRSSMESKKDVGPRYSATSSPLVSPLSLLVHLIAAYSNLD